MTLPAVTNTFSNATTADATEVNTNFTDIINALTDGTKTFSIDALTCAGAATLNGAVTLGNASGDDLTVTGSLASSIPIKTTNSYDIGANTLALRAAYIASTDGAAYAHKILGGTIGANYNFILPTFSYTNPTTDGTIYDLLQTNGSGAMSFQKNFKPDFLNNIGIGVVMAASACTITLTQADGSTAPTSAAPVLIAFRHGTITTGGLNLRAVTSSITTVISSGSTAGTASATANSIYIFAIDNAGTVELAWSRMPFKNENELVTTTAEGGAGGADNNGTMYSTTARTSVPFRMIGKFVSTQATAGTWATAASEVSVGGKDIIPDEKIFCHYNTEAGTTITSGVVTTVKMTNKVSDAFNTYDTSTGIWTCPKTAKYYLQGLAKSAGVAGVVGSSLQAQLDLNGATTIVLREYEQLTTQTQLWEWEADTVYSMTKGQTMYFDVYQNTATTYTGSTTDIRGIFIAAEV